MGQRRKLLGKKKKSKDEERGEKKVVFGRKF